MLLLKLVAPFGTNIDVHSIVDAEKPNFIRIEPRELVALDPEHPHQMFDPFLFHGASMLDIQQDGSADRLRSIVRLGYTTSKDRLLRWGELVR